MTDYTEVPDVTTGDTWTADNHDTYIRNNFKAVFDGTVAGELVKLNSGGKYFETAGNFGKCMAITKDTVTDATSDTEILFDGTDILDAQGWHNPSSNPDRITIKASGIFALFVGSTCDIDPTTTAKSTYVYVESSGCTISPSLSSGNAIEGAYYRQTPYSDSLFAIVTGGASDGYITVSAVNEFSTTKHVICSVMLFQLA